VNQLYQSRYDRAVAETHGYLEKAGAVVARAEKAGRDLTPDEEREAQVHLDRSRAAAQMAKQAKADAAMMDKISELGRAIGGPGSGKAGRSGWASTVADELGQRADTYGVKALVVGSIDVPSPLVADVVAMPQRPRRVTDLLVERVPLTGPTFEFLRKTVRTPNVRAVPDGAEKPVSTFTAVPVTDRARTFATLSEPIPERFFSDYAALTRWLETELEDAVLAEVERQVINGDGVQDEDHDNVTGILNTSGIVSVAYTSDVLTTTRKARTQMTVLDEMPSAWVINPSDLERIDLLRENGSTGGFLVGGSSAAEDNVFGGLPRVPSTLVPAGTAILADWSQVLLAVREDLRLDLDRSGENFKKNLVTARVEGRFGVGVLRPRSFCRVTLTA
jgi:HK97 family phage major capsid protein